MANSIPDGIARRASPGAHVVPSIVLHAWNRQSARRARRLAAAATSRTGVGGFGAAGRRGLVVACVQGR
jgi:hypothetical protein